uniref:PATROL1-like C-terminal domain-containing protein n=1 Tax=Palpitomonas bilix TaxID=652834 RepID=A0A7S3GG46_9EUKA|mmetsp:Transcript_4769/g.9994  ORF Transcript_4769/g.9994 Transcript_4769/m.9994 type:complete len:1051 (+) Transcript_4769:63-3215(+)
MERLRKERNLLLQYIFDCREVLVDHIAENAIPLNVEALDNVNVPSLVQALRQASGEGREHLVSSKKMVEFFSKDKSIGANAASLLSDNDDDHFFVPGQARVAVAAAEGGAVSLDNFLGGDEEKEVEAHDEIEEEDGEEREGEGAEGESAVVTPNKWRGKYFSEKSASLIDFFLLHCSDMDKEMEEEERGMVQDVIRAQLELSRRVSRRLSQFTPPDTYAFAYLGTLDGHVALLKGVSSAESLGKDEKFFDEWRLAEGELLLEAMRGCVEERYGFFKDADLERLDSDSDVEVENDEARAFLSQLDSVAERLDTSNLDSVIPTIISDLFSSLCSVMGTSDHIPLPRLLISSLLHRYCSSLILDQSSLVDSHEQALDLFSARVGAIFEPVLHPVEVQAHMAAAMVSAVYVGEQEVEEMVEHMQNIVGMAQESAENLVENLDENGGDDAHPSRCRCVSSAFASIYPFFCSKLSDYHQTFSVDIDGINLFLQALVECRRVDAIMKKKDSVEDFDAIRASLFTTTIGASVDKHLKRTLGNEFGGGVEDPWPRNEAELVTAMQKIKSELEGEFDYFLKGFDDEVGKKTAAFAGEGFIRTALMEVINDGYEIKGEIADVYRASRELATYLQELGACENGFGVDHILQDSLHKWTEVKLKECHELVRRCIHRDQQNGWPYLDPDSQQFFAPAVADISDLYFQFVDTFESLGITSAMDTVVAIANALDQSMTDFASELAQTIPKASMPELPPPVLKYKPPKKKSKKGAEDSMWGPAGTEEMHASQDVEKLLVRFNSAFRMLETITELCDKDCLSALVDDIKSEDATKENIPAASLLFPTSSAKLQAVCKSVSKYVAFKVCIFDLFDDMVGKLFRPELKQNEHQLGRILEAKVDPVFSVISDHTSSEDACNEILYEMCWAFYEMVEMSLIEGSPEDMHLHDFNEVIEREKERVDDFFGQGLSPVEINTVSSRMDSLIENISSTTEQLIDRYETAEDYNTVYYSKYHFFRLLQRRKRDPVAKKYVEKVFKNKKEAAHITSIKKTSHIYFDVERDIPREKKNS